MTLNKIRVAVIGSGHAAWGACSILVKSESIQLDVIDIGLKCPYPNQPETPVFNSKTCHGSYFPYGINDHRWSVKLESRRMCSSHAYGGFSNVYSGAILAPRTEDLVNWPKDAIPLQSDYLGVLSNIGVLGGEDALEQWSPLLPPAEISAHQTSASSSISVLGFSRIAIQRFNDEKKITPFNTSHTFSKHQEQNKINYIGSTYVISLERVANGTRIQVQTDGETKWFGPYEAVFVGAGCINTTGIVHRSNWPNKVGEYTLQNTAGFVQAFVGKGPSSSTDLEIRRQNNLPQIFVEIRDTAFNGYWSHTQISSINRHVLETIAQRFPNALLQKVSKVFERFHFAITNVPSILATQSSLVCNPAGSSPNMLPNTQIQINEPIQSIDSRWSRAVRSAIKQNRQILNLTHIPGTEFLGNLLRGNRLGGWHFGGAIPMSQLDNHNTCTPHGELRSIPGVFIVDSTAFPSIPGTTVALLSMANAARIARLWVEKRTS
jgi:hypothetical protein